MSIMEMETETWHEKEVTMNAKKIIIYCTSSHCAIVNADRQSSSSSGEKNRARKDIGIRIKNISDTHKFYIAALLNY